MRVKLIYTNYLVRIWTYLLHKVEFQELNQDNKESKKCAKSKTHSLRTIFDSVKIKKERETKKNVKRNASHFCCLLCNLVTIVVDECFLKIPTPCSQTTQSIGWAGSSFRNEFGHQLCFHATNFALSSSRSK